MALFVMLIVGVVVVQTWLDWRDARKSWVLPDWAKGVALAGASGALLTAVTSSASFLMQDASRRMERRSVPAILARVRFPALRLGCHSLRRTKETNARTARPIGTADRCILARDDLFVLAGRDSPAAYS